MQGREHSGGEGKGRTFDWTGTTEIRFDMHILICMNDLDLFLALTSVMVLFDLWMLFYLKLTNWVKKNISENISNYQCKSWLVDGPLI